MDGERTVESNGSRHTMPDEIMDMSAPLHCLERNIAQRVHSEVQREIREHDQTGCEAEPPDRHLIAKNLGIEHLDSGPPGLETQHRTKGIRVLQGARRQAANVRFGSKADIEAPSFDVRFVPKADISSVWKIRALGRCKSSWDDECP